MFTRGPNCNAMTGKIVVLLMRCDHTWRFDCCETGLVLCCIALWDNSNKRSNGTLKHSHTALQAVTILVTMASMGCPTIPISSGLSRFCLRIPTNFAIRIGKIQIYHLFWFFQMNFYDAYKFIQEHLRENT